MSHKDHRWYTNITRVEFTQRFAPVSAQRERKLATEHTF